MRYDFASRECEFGRVVFALTLNRKRMTERIIIGRTDKVRQRLENKTDEVFYDETRPLGSMLFTFESDKTGEWNKQGSILRNSYGKIFPMEAERWKMAAPVSAFLRQKYESGEPSAMFAAIRTWEDYLNCFHMNHGADVLNNRLAMLYKPFQVYADCKPWRKEAVAALTNAWQDGQWLCRDHALRCRDIIGDAAEIAAELITSDLATASNQPFGKNVENLSD